MSLWKRIGFLHRKIEGLKTAARILSKPLVLASLLLARIEGVENLQAVQGAVIYAFNHNSYFETIVVPALLMAATGRKICLYVHWMFNYFPFLGWVIRQIDPIWIFNRRARFRAILKRRPKIKPRPDHEAAQRLRQGFSVGIFPEGNRNNDPDSLLRGRMGLGELVARTRCRVVPVGIDFPKRHTHHKIPVVGRIILRIGAPLSADDLVTRAEAAAPNAIGDCARDNTVRCHRVYQEISHIVMRKIAVLSRKAYPHSLVKTV